MGFFKHQLEDSHAASLGTGVLHDVMQEALMKHGRSKSQAYIRYVSHRKNSRKTHYFPSNLGQSKSFPVFFVSGVFVL